MLSRVTRARWFVDHGSEMDDAASSAKSVLAGFDVFLRGLGLHIVVQGTGLARGARVARWEEALQRADVVRPDLELEADANGAVLDDGVSL